MNINSVKKVIKASAVACGAYAATGCVLSYLVLTPSGNKMTATFNKNNPEIERYYGPGTEFADSFKWINEADKEKIFTFNSKSETLNAWLIKNRVKSNIYVISCHGYTSGPLANAPFAKRFYDMGFNVILPALRGHNMSDHNYISMGWHDRLDIICWIEYIKDFDPDAEIILHGVSMGGATVMMTTGENLPGNVRCAIEDCGYSSVWDEFKNELNTVFKMPVFPFLTSGRTATKILFGYDFKKASSVDQVSKSKTPTLFIHGDSDNFVPTKMVYSVYDAADCDKDILIVPGASHAVSAFVNPDLYWSKVKDFIKNYI